MSKPMESARASISSGAHNVERGVVGCTVGIIGILGVGALFIGGGCYNIGFDKCFGDGATAPPIQSVGSSEPDHLAELADLAKNLGLSDNGGADTGSTDTNNERLAANNGVHTVIMPAGGTLSGVAAQNCTTAADVAHLNGIANPNWVYENQPVNVINRCGPTNQDGEQPSKKSGKFVVIRDGDNLFRIALRNGTTVPELQRLNGMGTDTVIYAGLSLRVH